MSTRPAPRANARSLTFLCFAAATAACGGQLGASVDGEADASVKAAATVKLGQGSTDDDAVAGAAASTTAGATGSGVSGSATSAGTSNSLSGSAGANTAAGASSSDPTNDPSTVGGAGQATQAGAAATGQAGRGGQQMPTGDIAGAATSAGAGSAGTAGANDVAAGQAGAAQDPTPAAGSAGGDATPAQPSSGCGRSDYPMSPGYQSTTSNGVERTYLVTLPDGYDPDVAYPLIFGFHGAGDTGSNFASWSGIPEQGDAIFIFGDGPAGIWAEEVYNSDFSMEDAAFDWVRSTYCIDEARVFAYGFSWGGWATTAVGCGRPEMIKGIASIAGGGSRCSAVMPTMLIHGTIDSAEPIASSRRARTIFVDNNSCSDTTEPTDHPPCVAHLECEEPVIWCEHPGEHGIPEFAPQAVWDFFESLGQ